MSEPIHKLDKQSKERRTDTEYIHPLDPHITYKHIYPKYSHNPTLRRCFKLHDTYIRNIDEAKYMRAYAEINRYSDILNLPNMVRMEAINMFKFISEKDDNFFFKYKLEPTFLALLKISCELHEFPIDNNDISALATYNLKDNINSAYMHKKFNKAYMNIKRLLNIDFIKRKTHPKYIDYVCNKLELPYECASEIHKLYEKLKNIIVNQNKIEGYILSLYYIKFGQKYNLTIKRMARIFNISPITIASRNKELKRLKK